MPDDITDQGTDDTQMTPDEKTEKRLRDKDAFIEKLKGEAQEAREAALVAQAKAETISQFVKPEEEVPKIDPFAMTEEEMAESMADPTIILRKMQAAVEQTRKETIALFQARDAAYNERIESVDPETKALEPFIKEFRADESLNDFSDGQIKALARREKAKLDAEEAESGGFAFDGQTGARVPKASQTKMTKETHPDTWEACLAMAPNRPTEALRIEAAEKIFKSVAEKELSNG